MQKSNINKYQEFLYNFYNQRRNETNSFVFNLELATRTVPKLLGHLDSYDRLRKTLGCAKVSEHVSLFIKH